MLPGLGTKFKNIVEVISKPRQEFQSPEYADLALPKAPAIMVGDEVVVAGQDIDEEELGLVVKQKLQSAYKGEV